MNRWNDFFNTILWVIENNRQNDKVIISQLYALIDNDSEIIIPSYINMYDIVERVIPNSKLSELLGDIYHGYGYTYEDPEASRFEDSLNYDDDRLWINMLENKGKILDNESFEEELLYPQRESFNINNPKYSTNEGLNREYTYPNSFIPRTPIPLGTRNPGDLAVRWTYPNQPAPLCEDGRSLVRWSYREQPTSYKSDIPSVDLRYKNQQESSYGRENQSMYINHTGQIVPLSDQRMSSVRNVNSQQQPKYSYREGMGSEIPNYMRESRYY